MFNRYNPFAFFPHSLSRHHLRLALNISSLTGLLILSFLIKDNLAAHTNHHSNCETLLKLLSDLYWNNDDVVDEHRKIAAWVKSNDLCVEEINRAGLD